MKGAEDKRLAELGAHNFKILQLGLRHNSEQRRRTDVFKLYEQVEEIKNGFRRRIVETMARSHWDDIPYHLDMLYQDSLLQRQKVIDVFGRIEELEKK